MFTFAAMWPQPKPEPQKRRRNRNKRFEAKVERTVRALVAARDGYCRRATHHPSIRAYECGGASEWAHWGEYKRFKTRGKPAEERHTTHGSLMLCSRHHRMYDAGEMTIEALSDLGCDGVLVMKVVRALERR